jgi:ornithine carbamoyltransferase
MSQSLRVQDLRIGEERGKKDLLTLSEFGPSDFKHLLDLSDLHKAERNARLFKHRVPETSLALIFEKPSTRTRVSFEVAMFEMGGHAVVLTPRDMQLSRGETLEDTAKTLSQFCQAIAARVYSHETLERFSKAVDIPIINALSDRYHPCQTVADLQTIREVKRNLKGLKLAWIGDGNNVCNSLLIGASLVGTNVVVACPEKFVPLQEAISRAREIAKITGSSIQVIEDPNDAVKDADVVATDTFVSMGNEDEKKDRLEVFLPKYQVNQKLFSKAKRDAVFMHCLPAHRGEEVTEDIIDGPRSIVWREAENRLHSQKAILYDLLYKYATEP